MSRRIGILLLVLALPVAADEPVALGGWKRVALALGEQMRIRIEGDKETVQDGGLLSNVLQGLALGVLDAAGLETAAPGAADGRVTLSVREALSLRVARGFGADGNSPVPQLVVSVAGEVRLERGGQVLLRRPFAAEVVDERTEGKLEIVGLFQEALLRARPLDALSVLLTGRSVDPVKCWRSLLGSDDPWVSAHATREIVRLPPAQALDLLTAGLGEPGISFETLDAIASFGATALARLATLPPQAGVFHRAHRIEALGLLALGEDEGIAEAALPLVAEGLRDPRVVVREVAVAALASLPGTRAAPSLIQALRDPSAPVSDAAAQALARLSGERHDRDVGAYEKWLRQKSLEEEGVAASSATAPLLPFGLRALGKGYAALRGKVDGRAAIQAGLSWLAHEQKPDGSLEPEADDGKGFAHGITALGALAFLGAGVSPADEGVLGRALSRNLSFLLEGQGKRGHFGPEGGHMVFCHGFATLAVLDAYGRAPSERLRAAAQRGLDWIAVARNPYFAWRYGTKPGDNDTAVTGCMMLPLYAARRINEVARLAKRSQPFSIDMGCFDGIEAWINKMTDRDYGRVGYIQPGGNRARYVGEGNSNPELLATDTAIGALHFSWSGRSLKDKDLLRMLEQVGRRTTGWSSGTGALDLYDWFHRGLAVWQGPPKLAKAFDLALVADLLQGQQKQGYFEPVDAWSPIAGKAYTTSMALLCLETPFLWPPLDPERKDLVASLADPGTDVEGKRAALRALLAQAPKKAAAPAAALLSHADERLRATALLVLAESGSMTPAHAPKVIALLKDASPRVREQAARALRRVVAKSPEGAGALVAALSDGEPSVRTVAAESLGFALGAPLDPAPALLKSLLDDQEAVASAALRALRALAKYPTSDVFLSFAKDARPAVRIRSLTWSDSSEARRAALDDADAGVRHAAAGLLSGDASPETVAGLAKRLRDPDVSVAFAAAESLGAAASAAAIDAAFLALAEEAPIPRRAGARALRRIGPVAADRGKEIEAVLRKEMYAQDRDPWLKIDLALALWRVAPDPERVPAVVRAAIESPDGEIAAAGAEAVAELGPAADPLVEPLTDLMSRGRVLLMAAGHGLGWIGPRSWTAKGIVTYYAGLYDDDAPVAHALRWSLDRIAGK